MTTQEILARAAKAKFALSEITKEERTDALLQMADALENATGAILSANEEDVRDASGRISPVMLDRLKLTKERIKDMSEGIRSVAALPDPVGEILSETVRPNGLTITKRSVPMGVIAIIYESRPNVTSDAAALAIKAGSAVVLRSGKDAHRSAFAIVRAMKEGLTHSSIPEDALFLVEDPSRASAEELMKARGIVDLLIPRGGKNLIQSCVENALVPVLETGTGICHLFADETADQEKALKIIVNAKTSRPSVCNAEEVLLVHEKIAAAFLPRVAKTLIADRIEKGLPPVELKLSKKALSLLPPGVSASYGSYVTEAGPDDFDTEFLDYKLAVGIVSGVREAIDHINLHSTHHSDGILTETPENATLFTNCVDSACCYVNASTRFTDGGEFGFGAEMGISTQKLHARGPVGLKELCSYKYVITGNGQTR